MTLLKAIATVEGFYLPGSRSQRNNNPGNLNWDAFSLEHGATRAEEIPAGFDESPRFAYFPDAVTGWAALYALLELPAYRQLTVEEMVAKYAPATENNVQSYTNSLCKLTGCKPTDVVSTLLETA